MIGASGQQAPSAVALSVARVTPSLEPQPLPPRLYHHTFTMAPFGLSIGADKTKVFEVRDVGFER